MSGGADSMTLLHCLLHSKKKLNLIVAHLNHKLRGNESDDDEKFVRNFCLQNNVRFVCRSVSILNISKLNRISVEMAGRNERYKFFNEFGRTVATAHTFSDKIETFFLNLARGTSLNGLCSISNVRGEIKRPLIEFKRFEIEQYCAENGLSYRNDSSNLSLVYFRNRIRCKVVPELKKLNFNFEFNMLKVFNCLNENEAYFARIISEIFKTDLINGVLKLNRFYYEHIAIKKRIIFQFLKLKNIQPTSLMIERILNLIQNKKSNVKISLPRGKIAVCYGNFLYVENKVISEAEFFNFVLPKSDEFFYKNLHFKKLSLIKFKYFLKKQSNLFLFKFDYDKIKGRLCVRSRMPGDRIKLLNRPTKKIKKLIQESKMSLYEREKIFILADDLGPIWAFGFGCDVRVLADNKTRNFMVVLRK